MRRSRHIVAWTLGISLGVALSGPRILPQTQAGSKLSSPREILVVQARVVEFGTFTGRFPEGSRIVRHVSSQANEPPINLTSQFFAAADPRVSFDGTNVLFSAQKEKGSTWQIWEMNVDGSNQRQITHCSAECLRPAYLPRDEIVFTEVAGNSDQLSSHLYVSKRDGSDVHPITFGPGNFQVETVLRNGMILASGRSPLTPATGGDDSRELYTLRPDGSGLGSFRCDHQQKALREQAEELDDGSVVYVKRASGQSATMSELAEVRRGALHNSPISLAPAAYASPRSLDGEKFIAARRSKSTGTLAGRYDLYAFDSARGGPGELVYRDRELSSLEAVPLESRQPPRWYWSTLNPALKVGYFVCLDSSQNSDAPRGRLAVPISSVRVMSLEADGNRERELGTAPVEQDGSFYIAVPPDQPVRFELLDKNGNIIKAQRSWIWARSGEEHGCAGCHESKVTTPQNRWPTALRRFDTPTRLGVPAAPVAAH